MSDQLNVAKKIFINEEGELRSVLRVLAFVLTVMLVATLINGILVGIATLFPALNFLVPSSDTKGEAGTRLFLYFAISQMTSFVAALLASAICARLLESRSFASVGYKLHTRWLRDFALGSLIGAGSLALVVGLQAAAGAVSLDLQSRDAWFLMRAFAFLFILFFISGAFEELLFRGFAFQALLHNNGAFVAVAITSIGFGLVHLDNANASVFSVLNTILAGVWLGIAYLMTRSLWLATALHYSWNLAMLFIFGLPVSGITELDRLSWLRGTPGSPVWISGGNYGPEAGAAVTVVLILSTLLIWKSRLFKPREEMLQALKHGTCKLGFLNSLPVSDEGERSSMRQDS